MKFHDRVRGVLWAPGSRILPAPKNYRLHEERQREVLRGLLSAIGLAGALLVWVPDGEARAALSAMQPGDLASFTSWAKAFSGDFQLIDGHLRAEEVRDQPLPVLVTDLNATEAAEVLATFDPVSDLAGFDAEMYRSLRQDFTSVNPAVASFVETMADVESRMRAIADATLGSASSGGDADPLEDGGDEDDASPPGPGDVPESRYAEQYGVIVLCKDAAHQEAVFTELQAAGHTCKVVTT